ncbi:MAG TPA: fasciclin domain-containing protein [Streptosporangiaceae bacterium]|nr:fasciclin domain-containing protein [Streptosporangiaceae bacterium]
MSSRARAVTAVIAPVVALAAAACSTTAGPAATGSGTPPPAGLVGADCGMFPAHGGGSVRTLRAKPVLAAASSNPQLSVFVAAVRTAGLDHTFAARRPFTLMIPANLAFGGLTRPQISTLHGHAALRRVVGYHAIGAAIRPAQFGRGASYRTVQGASLRVSRSGADYKVNGATVLCGNIPTAGGTLYVINKVLLPPGS